MASILNKIFKNSNGEYIDIFDVLLGQGNAENYIYTMAEAKAINLIAKTIAKTELLVFSKNEKSEKIENVKNDIYYMLNIQPNYNENGTEFLYKLALKLLIDKEALILINKLKSRKFLYVADTFTASNDILHSKTFKDITLSDKLGNSIRITKEYNQENAIYIALKNKDLTAAEENFKKRMGKLLKTVETKYKRANTSKWRLKKPGGQPTLMDYETGKEISYEEYTKKITDGLLSDEEAIILLAEAFDLINLNKDSKESLSDYKELIKNIGDSVASNYSIPLDLFYGTKTEKSTANDDFISFSVDFYYNGIEDGLNSVLVGQKCYCEGERIQFNKYSIFHKDIMDSASGIDKLISSTFSRNEINEFLNLPYIDEDWANKHNLTKNYGNVKGGGNNE
ncbi:MAG: phage portal protein [Clostridia bacterium]|nr:phage portal protein [Clostridia bacterium]